MTGDDIILERRKSVLFATLNRPQAKNALTAAMVETLIALADRLSAETETRALVLRGAGGAFCAGGDIKDFAAQMTAPDPAPGEPDPIATGNRRFGELLLKLDAIPQVFVCAVEGPAFGGAMGFLSVADLVIASEDAKFSLSETTLGLPPAQIGPFVVRKIGLFNARRLALTGARFGVEEAMRVGLIDRAAPAEGLSLALIETLNTIGRCEPAANAATKRILNGAGPSAHPRQLDAASRDFAACLRGAGRTGAGAFAMKQPAPWVQSFVAGDA